MTSAFHQNPLRSSGQANIRAQPGSVDAPHRVQPGDLWQLGEHRLLCGDSADLQQVKYLMQGEQAHLTVTSPPYNLGHSASLSRQKWNGTRYLGDSDSRSPKDYLHLLTAVTENALAVSTVVIVNIQMLSGNKVVLIEYLHRFCYHLIDIAIWDKGSAQPAMAKNILNSRFEFLLFFTNHRSKGKTPRTILTADFRGTVANVYQGAPQRHNSYFRQHAATFPLHLPLWLMETFDAEGGTVFDPFCGTATTLLAAQQLGQKCMGIEIEPLYVELALRRWEDLTGQRAKRIRRYSRPPSEPTVPPSPRICNFAV